MKRSHRFTSLGASLLCISAGIAFILNSSRAEQPAREELWKKVAESEHKTAIEYLDRIIESAIKDKQYPEAIKALCKKVSWEGAIESAKWVEKGADTTPADRVGPWSTALAVKIVRMKAAVATAPAEMRPVMNAILARWYWDYWYSVQRLRWWHAQRSATAGAPDTDMETWDLTRTLAEVDRTFDRAFADEAELKATPIARYDLLLEKGDVPDKYRPTLFDFLAFDALRFYASAEQASVKPEDNFELPADSPIFGSVDDFLAWDVQTPEANGKAVKSIALYKKLLGFHKDDADRSAMLDADLHRLRFGWNKAVGEKKNARYKAALEAFAKANDKHELSAQARYQLADVLQGEGDLVKAREVALTGATAFPDSNGGKRCFNLVQEIESKSADTTTDRVWADPLPTIKVTYKNITRAYFRVVSEDFARRLRYTRNRPEELGKDDAKVLLKRKPVLEFSQTLPATTDYKPRTEAVPAPKGLKPGFYYLIVSHSENFGEDNNAVSYTPFWVSDLAIIHRLEPYAHYPGIDPRNGKFDMAGLVTDNRTGTPIEGAKVQLWSREVPNHWDIYETTTTDRNGMYKMTAEGRLTHLVSVTYKDQQLSSSEWFAGDIKHFFENEYTRSVLFTDRSLYRPGQTIYYKGVTIRFDRDKDKYETVANEDVEVIFSDANGKEVARHKTKSNDYGSFSGTFTAPRDRRTGRMGLRTADGGRFTVVTVEEYKRPKFKVEVDALREPGRLNGTVKVPGKAVQYNGVPVGGAKVTFRVTREVHYPDWFSAFRWHPGPVQPAQEIAHGVVTSDPDGSFIMPFRARPDLTVSPKDEPTFRYTVTADVTDTTGETRTATKSVEVGYVSLRATVSADEWLISARESAFAISTTTLDGEGQAAKGTLTIHALKQPDRVTRPDLTNEYSRYGFRRAPTDEPPTGPSNPLNWELGAVVFTSEFATNGKGKVELKRKLPAGIYRAILETTDAFGTKVTAKYQFTVLDPAADTFGVKVPHFVAAPAWVVDVGKEFTMLWGSGYDTARAYIEVEHRGKILQGFWTEPGKTQTMLRQQVNEGMRGGFTVRVTQVRENRAYLTSRHVDVPWTNKNLTVKWERFVSKLEPGAKETFTAVITGPDAKKAVAEMVAALYDSSLDAYLPHDWMQRFDVFHQDQSDLTVIFNNTRQRLYHIHGDWPDSWKGVDAPHHREFMTDLASGFNLPSTTPPRVASWSPPPVPPKGLGDGPGLDLNISPRKNLNETAFFFPHLTSDADGTVRIQFTMPEALTKWKFLGFAHDKNLRSGFLTDSVVTARDLMVQPNPPRFLREGDVIEFTVKVSNQSATRQKGTTRLSFRNARSDKPVDALLGLANADQPFDLAAGESKTLSWKIRVPDDIGPITYKAVAATDRLSDGEEAIIPVLSKRVLVMESLPLPIRGPATKDFDFTRLRKSADSQTIKNQSLTVQMVSQPSWYAVMALPYLMEYPYECSEQTFNRLYANALARHIASSDPKIRRIFDQWKGTPALDSPLEKNQDLKNVLLEETPWVRQAQAESQARKNVGILFDDDRLNAEIAAVTQKLAQMQYADGSWPWFPGGRGNDYITLYITTGYGRMRHLGVKVDPAPAVKALDRLDGWARERYQWAQKHKPEENHLSATLAFYLYGRSFFLADKAIANEHRAAIDYWLDQAKKYWPKLGDRQSQAHLALALKRFNDKETPGDIMKSIKERSKNEEELGMYWRDTELSFSWARAPIETQAMMIEAFDEVMNDAQAVEDCKVWLLKQKQTQGWKTTKATADAVYALLLRGDNLLKSDALVEVTVGNQLIKPEKVEAGTGFYEQKFLRTEVQPSMGTIQVKKTDKGVSWGSIHWSYLEDISKVTPHDGTPLKLEKKLYKKTLTKSGPVIQPVKEGEALAVGDEVIVRIVLRTDRDMEYVHMKDHRGSGTEPVNVLSRYKYQDGLGYYESTKDTASHFFIDYLPKGVYVFEYAVRVQLKGKYPTGFANIECMYAPEFNSHSENINLEVR